MQPRWILMLVFATVLAWGTYLAVGAYLYNNDPRRGLIVMGSFAFFLAFWGAMLGLRARRTNSSSEPSDNTANEE